MAHFLLKEIVKKIVDDHNDYDDIPPFLLQACGTF